MRRRIIREGVLSLDGRGIEVGALEFVNDRCPLTMQPEPRGDGHEGAVLCGYFDKPQREADGWITVEVTMADPIPEGWGLNAELDIVTFSDRTDGLWVKEGRLRAAMVGDGLGWPGLDEVL